jgi:phosphoadenosine phosphosulfate reductase
MTAATTTAARAFRGTATEGRSEAELKELVRHAGAELELAPAEVIIEWAVATFGERFCITSSMGDAVLAHLASKVAPGVDVLFLDTGYHFAETLQTLDRIRERYRVNVRVIRPRQSVAEQDGLFGARLHDRDPDACCTLRKVEPLRRALQPYVAWASGIRRDETLSRRSIGVVDWDDNRGMVKINPLATWTQQQVDRYVADHDVITHPLLAQGYPSIGCAPCTRKVKPGESPRAGRWAGTGKDECGLHLDPPQAGPDSGNTSLDLTGGSFISLPKEQ